MLEKILYWSERTIAKLYMALLLEMDIQWHAPLPVGPKIIAVNHPSTTDPFLITGLFSEQMSILTRESCFKLLAFGSYLRRAGHVPVIEGNGQAALAEAKKLLAAGRTIGIFPEGVLSPWAGGVGKPHTGVARLALSTGAPVVPIGIHLQYERIRVIETHIDDEPEVIRWYFRGPYAITVGEPMHFTGNVEDREYTRSVSERIMQRIDQLAHQSAIRLSQTSPTFVSGSIPIPVEVIV